jgi:hypothetical protein
LTRRLFLADKQREARLAQGTSSPGLERRKRSRARSYIPTVSSRPIRVLVLSLCLVRWQTTIAPAQISRNSNSWVGCASELMAITGIYLLPATNYKSLPHGHYVGELSRNLALAKNTPANRPACMVKCSRPLVIYRVQKVFSLFVDITYQTECSKNSACLYEH